jgi:hypothetical protein
MADQIEAVVHGQYIRESGSGKAILIEQGGEEYWIPRSQISFQLRMGKDFECRIPLWLAREKGLDYDER